MRVQVLFIFIYFFNVLIAKPNIEFSETEHNFKVIKEEDGIVKHTFKFQNIGDEPLQIYKVEVG